jgi:NAD+ kinase
LFEVACDGVVAGTPAGSTAYSLAAGGPLLGITVSAYVISLVAAHAVGVRPVVAGTEDVLEITNTDDRHCYLDIDGQRVKQLGPGAVVRVQTVPGLNSLALLQEDSLYHHFRDRLL